jgi:hypothetical protein
VETWLALKCNRFDLADVFTGLAANLIVRIASSAPQAVLEDVVVILEEWRALLGVGGRLQDDCCGLVGELLMLRRLACSYPERAWRSWEGPRGGRHDFRFGLGAIETKTTLRPTAKVVSINGLTQLEAPLGGKLHLVFIRLERVPSGAFSLSSIFNDVVAAGVPKGELQSLWEDAEFTDLDDAESRQTYELREMSVYQVLPGFPRITPKSFATGEPPPGVGALSYQCDLAHQIALPTSVADTFIDTFLR